MAMKNPRNQYDSGFLDDLQHFWAQNISKIGDVLLRANDIMREVHKRVRADPSCFVEMTGAIRAEGLPSETLLTMATIAETLVILDEKDVRFAPLIVQYRANVDFLFVKYFRTILESILAVFLGDDKAKEYAKQADKSGASKKFNPSDLD